MNGKLHHVEIWSTLAKQANWSASKLAKYFGVTVQTLHRYFVAMANMGKNTKCCLSDQRQCAAKELLRECFSIKETAARLGYKHQSSFTREFRRFLLKYAVPKIISSTL